MVSDLRYVPDQIHALMKYPKNFDDPAFARSENNKVALPSAMPCDI